MVLEVGRVCIKTAGREAGKPCVVIDAIDDTYVMITGPKSLTKVKRRKCNIAHLEPLEFQLKLAKNAPDNEVARLLEAEKILEKLIPGKAVIKPEKPKGEFRKEKPERGKVPEKEKKGLRERLLGRAKGEEKPKEEKKPGKPKEEKKPGKPKEEKKPEKPKEKPKPAKKPKTKHKKKK